MRESWHLQKKVYLLENFNLVMNKENINNKMEKKSIWLS
jgi:hypothetical protein